MATRSGLARIPRSVTAGSPGTRWINRNVTNVMPSAIGISSSSRRLMYAPRLIAGAPPGRRPPRPSRQPHVLEVVVPGRCDREAADRGGLRVRVRRVVQLRERRLLRDDVLDLRVDRGSFRLVDRLLRLVGQLEDLLVAVPGVQG